VDIYAKRAKFSLNEGDDELSELASVPKDRALSGQISIAAGRRSPSSLTATQSAARTSAGGPGHAKNLTPERRRETVTGASKAAKGKKGAKRKKADSGNSEPDAGGLGPTEKVIIGGETGEGVPNSKRFSCLFCGADTWLAPASQSILKSEQAAVICLPCYLTNPQIPLGETYTTAQGRQELVDILGEDTAQQCLTEGVELIREAKRKRTPEPWKV
jgi:hypothetical protein